jgi:hypothetical protein
MYWDLVGAAIGALFLTVFLIAAGHPRFKGQRIVLIGLGLAIFSVPTFFGSMFHTRTEEARTAREAATAEARVQRRFDMMSDQLDGAFRGILAALTAPGQTTEQRRVAVANSVARYNRIVTSMRPGRPVAPLPVPLLAPASTPPSNTAAPRRAAPTAPATTAPSGAAANPSSTTTPPPPPPPPP